MPKFSLPCLALLLAGTIFAGAAPAAAQQANGWGIPYTDITPDPSIRYGILPQLMPNFASTAIYRFDINLRDATVLGLVGAGGIGAPLIFAMNSYRWEEAGAILAGLIVLVLIVEWISTKIRVKLARG